MTTKALDRQNVMTSVGIALVAELAFAGLVVRGLNHARQTFGITDAAGVSLPTLGGAIEVMSRHPVSVIVWQILLTAAATALSLRFRKGRRTLILGVLGALLGLFALVIWIYPVAILHDVLRQLGA
ncbi:hypothetical protein [Deinococcus aquiradiocola]|uniref:Uncharacterized protein n=1 Tax=Deinococcus aquiradiocola TaxID=393059 RepID=A0A917PQN6_9DEIO|nr:hypothetical protein [Deinococcus aquiradiocola]GGJ87542.1 hypothetical protein GCM10008939_34560 [Deinococcus aquiradiocola]